MLPPNPMHGEPGTLLETWHAGTGPGAATARATIALALLALGRAADADSADRLADNLWTERLRAHALVA